jgi:hypothetical protein
MLRTRPTLCGLWPARRRTCEPSRRARGPPDDQSSWGWGWRASTTTSSGGSSSTDARRPPRSSSWVATTTAWETTRRLTLALGVGGVDEHVREDLAGQGAVPERGHLGVEVGADPAHFGLGDAAVGAKRADRVVDFAGADAVQARETLVVSGGGGRFVLVIVSRRRPHRRGLRSCGAYQAQQSQIRQQQQQIKDQQKLNVEQGRVLAPHKRTIWRSPWPNRNGTQMRGGAPWRSVSLRGQSRPQGRRPALVPMDPLSLDGGSSSTSATRVRFRFAILVSSGTKARLRGVRTKALRTWVRTLKATSRLFTPEVVTAGRRRPWCRDRIQ